MMVNDIKKKKNRFQNKKEMDKVVFVDKKIIFRQGKKSNLFEERNFFSPLGFTVIRMTSFK